MAGLYIFSFCSLISWCPAAGVLDPGCRPVAALEAVPQCAMRAERTVRVQWTFTNTSGPPGMYLPPTYFACSLPPFTHS